MNDFDWFEEADMNEHDAFFEGDDDIYDEDEYRDAEENDIYELTRYWNE